MTITEPEIDDRPGTDSSTDDLPNPDAEIPCLWGRDICEENPPCEAPAVALVTFQCCGCNAPFRGTLCSPHCDDVIETPGIHATVRPMFLVMALQVCGHWHVVETRKL